MPKDPDKIGPLNRKRAIATYRDRFGRSPMEDPPAVWANLAFRMAEEGRSVVAYLSWYEKFLERPKRPVALPHVPPPPERYLELVVPEAVDFIYGWRRRGLMDGLNNQFAEMRGLFLQLIEYRRHLRTLNLVDDQDHKGRPPEWGIGAFAYMFPFLWDRHEEREPISNEIVALAARALGIGDETATNPMDYWRKCRRRVEHLDPLSSDPRPETALIWIIRKEHGDRWDEALRDLLARGVVRGQRPEG